MVVALMYVGHLRDACLTTGHIRDALVACRAVHDRRLLLTRAGVTAVRIGDVLKGAGKPRKDVTTAKELLSAYEDMYATTEARGLANLMLADCDAILKDFPNDPEAIYMKACAHKCPAMPESSFKKAADLCEKYTTLVELKDRHAASAHFDAGYFRIVSEDPATFGKSSG